MTQITAKSRSLTQPGRVRRRSRRTGFTLIELAVALTVILMIVGMVIPTLTNMLESRAEMEAFNLVAAQLTAARAEAITENTYAGIHVQLGAQGTDIEETSYSMIISLSAGEVLKDNPVFTRNAAFLPRTCPAARPWGN